MILQRSEQQIIAELDSAMNNWMDSVPQHCLCFLTAVPFLPESRS